jgi:hypothetical protein
LDEEEESIELLEFVGVENKVRILVLKKFLRIFNEEILTVSSESGSLIRLKNTVKNEIKRVSDV